MLLVEKVDGCTLREHGAWLLTIYDDVRKFGDRKYLYVSPDTLSHIIYYRNGIVDGIQLIDAPDRELLLVA